MADLTPVEKFFLDISQSIKALAFVFCVMMILAAIAALL